MEKISTATGVVSTVFTTNVKTKGLTAITVLLLDKILSGNELLITLIFILFFIDLIIGIALAIKKRNFCSGKFFMGVSKLIIYGIFILIGVSLDEALYTGSIFTGSIFAFIIVTDALSILTNLDNLGYNTPIFIKNYLLKYKKELNGKFKNK